ncbi:MAG: GNAT family N-acetyltransferase [Parvularculaceae bacterium]
MTELTLTLRRARPDDAASLRDAMRNAYATAFVGYNDEPTRRSLVAALGAPPEALLTSPRFYVVEAADRDGRARPQAIACGGWSVGPRRSDGGRTAHLRRVACHPVFSGRGAGRAIVEACARGAVAADCDALACVSTLPAEGFYAGLGFEHVDFVDKTLAGRMVKAVLMRRALRDRPLKGRGPGDGGG